MALKSSDPSRHPSANPKLGPAIARFAQNPTREQREQLIESLMAGPLLIAIHELPEAFDPGQNEQGSVRFVTAQGPEKTRVMCGFSGAPSLAAKAPAAIGLAIDPASLMEWIVETGMEGLLLDPEGPSAYISNDDARKVLGFRARLQGAGRSISLGDDLENAVCEALGRLLECADPQRTVTVREPKTGKSVLFVRAEADALMMVLDAASLSQDERERAQLLFDELAGHAEDLPEPEGDAARREECADFRALFGGDVGQPAKATIKVFTWVFGFLPGFQLAIDEQ